MIQATVEQAAGDDLRAVEQQGEEREEEEAEDEVHRNAPPLVLEAGGGVELADVIPEGLFRDVRGVDQEVLREADVRPEDGEGQHQAAEDVAVGLVEEAVEPAAVGQLVGEDHRDREGEADGEREEPHAVHGREPVVREGHQAVEGEHRERHGAERDADGGDGVQAVRVAGGAVGILGEGPAAQERGEQAEDADVEGDADEEERSRSGTSSSR
jgi:hypothetical protein